MMMNMIWSPKTKMVKMMIKTMRKFQTLTIQTKTKMEEKDLKRINKKRIRAVAILNSHLGIKMQVKK